MNVDPFLFGLLATLDHQFAPSTPTSCFRGGTRVFRSSHAVKGGTGTRPLYEERYADGSFPTGRIGRLEISPIAMYGNTGSVGVQTALVACHSPC